MTTPSPTDSNRIADSNIVDAISLLVDEFWDQEEADYNEQREQAEQTEGGDDNLGYHPFNALQELKAWLDGPQPTACANGITDGLCGDEQCQHCVTLALATDAELHTPGRPETATLTLVAAPDRKPDATQ